MIDNETTLGFLNSYSYNFVLLSYLLHRFLNCNVLPLFVSSFYMVNKIIFLFQHLMFCYILHAVAVSKQKKYQDKI